MVDPPARRAIDLLRPVIDLDEELAAVDLRQPRASATRMRERLEAAFADVRGGVVPDGGPLADLAKRGLRPEMKQMMVDGIHEVGERVRRDPAGEQLLRLLSAAEDKRPGAGIGAFGYLQTWKPVEWGTPPAVLLDDARSQPPEQSALTLKRAINEIAEPGYDRYVRKLWALIAIVEGGSKNPPGHFGAVIDQIAPRLRAFPDLVHVDAAFLRNAAGHNNFAPRADASVELWNDPPRERREIWSLHALHAFAQRMLSLSMHVARDAHSFFVNERIFLRSGFIGVLFDEMPAALALPEIDRPAAIAAVAEKLMPLLASIAAAQAPTND